MSMREVFLYGRGSEGIAQYAGRAVRDLLILCKSSKTKEDKKIS